MTERCEWVTSDPVYTDYHDNEWGRPLRDDRLLFEFLTLEGAQAGLSWITVLKKRDNYRRLFDDFDFEKISRYNDKKVSKLLLDPGIIRNRLKVNSTVKNARGYIKVIEEYGSFSEFIWRYVDGKPIQNKFKKLSDIPGKTPLSDQISKDLKKRGFSFVGSTIIYAFMQATGMVNDHIQSCFCYKDVAKLA